MLTQGRFRKVSVRIWADAKFQSLSRPGPNAQTLWFYLLTAPEGFTIPGVIPVSVEALAKALRWKPSDVTNLMRELETHGMALSDVEVGLVYLPRSIIHNKPESPNVIKGWAVRWPEVPECSLKNQILASVRAQVETYGKSWVKAFEKAFGEGHAEAFEDQREESESQSSTEGFTESRARARARARTQEEDQDTNTGPRKASAETQPQAPATQPEEREEEPRFAHPESVADLFGGPPPSRLRKDVPHQEIRDLYHEILVDLPRVKFLTEPRKAKIRARWREDSRRQTLDWWRRYFTYVRDHCPFLMGQVEPSPGRRVFMADLEWLVNQSNMVKVLERNYERRDPSGRDHRPE